MSEKERERAFITSFTPNKFEAPQQEEKEDDDDDDRSTSSASIQRDFIFLDNKFHFIVRRHDEEEGNNVVFAHLHKVKLQIRV